MAIICGPITTEISLVSKTVCGHLVKIYNIQPMFETLDILIDNSIMIPGVGQTSNRINNERVLLSLISKNVSAGTAKIVFTLETVTQPPVSDESTHHLDLYLKPFSWYSSGGAADEITRKLGDINGTVLNIFSQYGISDYQYLGSEVIGVGLNPGAPAGNVTIRIKLKKLEGLDGLESLAVPLVVYIAGIVAAVLVIIIIIGVITGWKFTLSGVLEQITGKKYSEKEVAAIVYDNVVQKQLDECDKNYTSVEAKVGCQKSAICGAANGLSDAFDLASINCSSLGVEEKIDICLNEYRLTGDKAKYDSCVRGVASSASNETKNKVKDGTDWMTIALLVGGVYLLGTVISKGGN